jgi:hypothetical protein
MKEYLILDKVGWFLQQALGVAWRHYYLHGSSYICETNVVGKVIDSTFNQNPASP